MNYKVICEFDGRAFCGWQTQKKANTIQDNIEKALEIIYKKKIGIIGCGRTDAGVSAFNYVFNFKTAETIMDKRKILSSLNALTDSHIYCKSLMKVNDEFHSRFSCKSREYKYYIYNGKSPIKSHFHTEYQGTIDIDRINIEMKSLEGVHDFSSFCIRQSLKKNNRVHMYKANIRKNGREYIFTLRADRFLHSMIRLIIGSLLEISEGKTDLNIKNIMQKNDIKFAGKSASPDGLLFYRAYY